MAMIRTTAQVPMSYARTSVGAAGDLFDISGAIQGVVQKQIDDAMIKVAIGGAVLLLAVVGTGYWVKNG